MRANPSLAATALPYPRSFLGLLLAGFTLVALPLAGALAYSAWNTERLAEQSRNAVFSAAQAARASRSLVNRIGSIERLAQQVTLLADPVLMEDYARVHRSFKQVSSELSLLPLDTQQQVALKRTVEEEQALYSKLTVQPRGSLDPSAISAEADRLADNAYEMLAISYLVADREVDRLRSSAEVVQQRLVSLVMFSTALALALALAFTRFIARPIAELDASIRQLGSADFTRPIRVRGPADLRYLGEQLDWLRRQLTELDAQKNRFLRNVSHELKTPLTALREGAELLNDGTAGALAPQAQQVVSIMRDNSVKLQRLIEDLLDYQRALHATASLNLQSIQLGTFVRDSARSHELAAKAKRLRVALYLLPVTVRADPQKLRSIVDNLVGNAVKFTPDGGTISLVAREFRGEAMFEVIDSGPGVPAEERELVFDSFFRGRTEARGRIQGSGLGLAIVREYVEAHGGRIAVVEGSHGGHFRVMLPREVTAVVPVAA